MSSSVFSTWHILYVGLMSPHGPDVPHSTTLKKSIFDVKHGTQLSHLPSQLGSLSEAR